MHTEKKIRYNATIKISLYIPFPRSPVIHGRLEGWWGEAEPAGSAADVEETWLPGNQLVTKEAEGWGGGWGEHLPGRLAPSFCGRYGPHDSPLGLT